MATISFARPKNFYKEKECFIYINDNLIGTLQPGKIMRVEINSGLNSFRADLDKTNKADIKLSFDEKEDITLQLERNYFPPLLQGLMGVIGILMIFMMLANLDHESLQFLRIVTVVLGILAIIFGKSAFKKQKIFFSIIKAEKGIGS